MDDNDTKAPVGLRSELLSITERFAETTAIVGPAHIIRSTHTLAKIAWLFAFLTCLGIAISQVATIFSDYLGFPVSIKVDMKTVKSPDFPSVTLCNLNPVRKSKLHLSPALVALLEESTGQRVDDEGGSTTAGGNTNQTTTFSDTQQELGITDMDEYDLDSTMWLLKDFRQTLGLSMPDDRREMGHQRSIMILNCSYNGQLCNSTDFTQIFSNHYGNCYTFNSAWSQNTSRRVNAVGSSVGLKLWLYKEDLEYIHKVTPGGGWRLVIHPFRTLPVPFSSGIWLSPGMETFAPITYHSVQRLGRPYSECNTGRQFSAMYYGLNYTVEACHATCLPVKTLEICHCYFPENIEHYPTNTKEIYPKCKGKGRKCGETVRLKRRQGQLECTCLPACSEISITTSTSVDSFPNTGQYERLVTQVCSVVEYVDQCDYFKQFLNASTGVKDTILRLNFGAVNIHLNTFLMNTKTEIPAYPVSRMGASVGGSLVLWLGFSVVASAEIAIFLWQILRALYKWARSRRTNAVQDTCYKGGDTDDTDKQDHPNDVNG